MFMVKFPTCWISIKKQSSQVIQVNLNSTIENYHNIFNTQ